MTKRQSLIFLDARSQVDLQEEDDEDSEGVQEFYDDQGDVQSDSEISESDASESTHPNSNSEPAPSVGSNAEQDEEAAEPSRGAPRVAKSRPARLVLESMMRPASLDKHKKNIPLEALTFADVALDEADLQQDITEIWTAM